MAFTYTDYMSSVYTPTQRVERCRLFISELTLAAANPDLSDAGQSISYAGLQGMLQAAKNDLRVLETDPRLRSRGTASIARINR